MEVSVDNSTHVDNGLKSSSSAVAAAAAEAEAEAEAEATVVSSPRHRTLNIEKKDGSFGFSIQSYGLQYFRDSEVDVITYIDHVTAGGPAEQAGMRRGDVILSINGQDMESCDHEQLVRSIRQWPDHLLLEVSFEDCVRKVRLHMRYIHLQRLLNERMAALDRLNEQEKLLIAKRSACKSSVSLTTTSSSSGSSSLFNRTLFSRTANRNRTWLSSLTHTPSAKNQRRSSTSAAASTPASAAAANAFKSSTSASGNRCPTAGAYQYPVYVWRPAKRGLSWDNICQMARDGLCDPAPPPPAASKQPQLQLIPAAAGAATRHLPPRRSLTLSSAGPSRGPIADCKCCAADFVLLPPALRGLRPVVNIGHHSHHRHHQQQLQQLQLAAPARSVDNLLTAGGSQFNASCFGICQCTASALCLSPLPSQQQQQQHQQQHQQQQQQQQQQPHQQQQQQPHQQQQQQPHQQQHQHQQQQHQQHQHHQQHQQPHQHQQHQQHQQQQQQQQQQPHQQQQQQPHQQQQHQQQQQQHQQQHQQEQEQERQRRQQRSISVGTSLPTSPQSTPTKARPWHTASTATNCVRGLPLRRQVRGLRRYQVIRIKSTASGLRNTGSKFGSADTIGVLATKSCCDVSDSDDVTAGSDQLAMRPCRSVSERVRVKGNVSPAASDVTIPVSVAKL